MPRSARSGFEKQHLDDRKRWIYPKVFSFDSSFPQPSPVKVRRRVSWTGRRRKEPVFLRWHQCSGPHPRGLRRTAAGARRALRTAHAVGSAAVLRGGLGLLGRLGRSCSTPTTTTCGGRTRGRVKTPPAFKDFVRCRNIGDVNIVIHMVKVLKMLKKKKNSET